MPQTPAPPIPPPPVVPIRQVVGAVWAVVRVRPRMEKQFAQWAAHLNVPVYLPLVRRVHHYARTKATFDVPLFSGYVFAQMTLNGGQSLEQNRFVAGLIVPQADQEVTLIRELTDIQRLLSTDDTASILVSPALEAGKLVEIRAGPFMGLSGVVTRLNTHARVSVNIEMIGRSVSVDVDLNELDVAD